MLERIRQALFREVDIASLAAFRVLFGTILLVEFYRYFSKGWIESFYLRPEFLFKYYGFGWVDVLPGNGMQWLFVALTVLAFLILIGAFYRLSMILFTLGFSYIFLLEQARYLNHFYLVILVSILMCFLPANRAYSIDARLRPSMRSTTIPGWAVWILVVQFEIMYLFAGFVKLNPDWLRLQPLTMWLAADSGLPIIGSWFLEKWVVAVGAYGVIALHLIGAPLLLFRKTRPYVFVVYVMFHLMNHTLFEIGIFPWMTIAGTLMFFEPDWPRRAGRFMSEELAHWTERLRGLEAGTLTRHLVMPEKQAIVRAPPRNTMQVMIMVLISAWVAYQILMPLRHYVYPGDVAWTEEGHRWAWRMKLRDKKGSTRFFIRDPVSGRRWDVNSRGYLTRRQNRVMACRPDMVLQFAHYLREVWVERFELDDVAVHADSMCSLNGRARERLIDPERDLAAIQPGLAPADWILPASEPLPPWPGGR